MDSPKVGLKIEAPAPGPPEGGAEPTPESPTWECGIYAGSARGPLFRACRFETGQLVPHGVHQFPALKIGQSLPRTERILARSLMLPMNSSLTDEEVSYVCDVIHDHYND